VEFTNCHFEYNMDSPVGRELKRRADAALAQGEVFRVRLDDLPSDEEIIKSEVDSMCWPDVIAD
jgi:hypothetical protein